MNVISISSTSSPRPHRLLSAVGFSIRPILSILIPSLEMFGLQGPEAYAYTSASNCLEVSDIDDAKDYHDTIVRFL